MKAFLDQSELALDRPSLAAALDAARSAAQQAGRVIIEVKLDGSPLPDGQIESPSDLPMESGRLEFVTTDPRALVRTTFLDVADALAATRDQQLKAAEALQAGEFKDAFAGLNDIVSLWSNVRRAVSEGPALLGLTPDKLDSGREIAAGIERLSAALLELRSSLQSQDWSTLADLLSGELDELAALWDGLLRSAAARLPARP